MEQQKKKEYPFKTKAVEIDWPPGNEEGKKSEVILKRMGFGERNRYRERCFESNMDGDKVSARAKMFEGRTILLHMTLVEAPFPNSMESLDVLDPDIGDLLHDEASKLNNLDKDKKKESPSQ